MGDRPCPRPTRVRGESGQRPTAAQGCRGRGSTGRGSECTSPLPKDKIPNSDKLPRFQSPGSLWAFPGGGSSQGAAEASGRLSWGAQPKHPEEGWPGSRALASQAGSEGRARSGWGAPVSHCGLGSFCLYPLCRPPGEPGPVPGWPSTVDGHVGRGPGPTLRPGRGAAPPAPLPRGRVPAAVTGTSLRASRSPLPLHGWGSSRPPVSPAAALDGGLHGPVSPAAALQAPDCQKNKPREKFREQGPSRGAGVPVRAVPARDPAGSARPPFAELRPHPSPGRVVQVPRRGPSLAGPGLPAQPRLRVTGF